MILTAPAATASPTNFDSLIRQAVSLRGSHGEERALDMGVEETALLRYVSGAVSTYERGFINALAASNDWVLKQIVRLTKQKRRQRRVA